jgi:uncharacterized protein (TIGR03435 family)
VTRLGPLLILLVVSGFPLVAQQSAPAFEVASVKPRTPDPSMPPLVLPPVGGRFLVTNTPLRVLISIAHGIQDFQIIGGPSWIDSSTFDITAKTPNGTPSKIPSITPMLQTLLAERFRLRTHTETKEGSIYVLTFARDNKQLGPNFKRSTTDCSKAAEEMEKRAAAVASGSIGPVPTSGETIPCAAVHDTSGGFGLRANGQPLTALTQFLMPLTERIVQDRTGLTGLYDWVLSYDPGVRRPGRLNNGPDLFTALQEQLGLKLESARGSVEMLVIDSVDRPTPD